MTGPTTTDWNVIEQADTGAPPVFRDGGALQVRIADRFAMMVNREVFGIPVRAKSWPANGIVKNLFRETLNATTEYQNAAGTLVTLSNHMSAVYLSNHLQNCIMSLCVADRLLSHVDANLTTWMEGSEPSHLPPEHLIEAARMRPLRSIRNRLQHLEDRLDDSLEAANQGEDQLTLFIRPFEHHLKCFDVRVEYEVLYAHLESFVAAAEWLDALTIPPTTPPTNIT